jgi:K+-transporting ATPase KdpF subunit
VAVILDYLLGSALAVAMAGYLVYALLRPEKF